MDFKIEKKIRDFRPNITFFPDGEGFKYLAGTRQWVKGIRATLCNEFIFQDVDVELRFELFSLFWFIISFDFYRCWWYHHIFFFFFRRTKILNWKGFSITCLLTSFCSNYYSLMENTKKLLSCMKDSKKNSCFLESIQEVWWFFYLPLVTRW